MPETTWRDEDSTRMVLRRMLHESGINPQTRIEVEDVETAVELVGMGLADTVIPKGAAASAPAPAGPGRPVGCRCAQQVDTFAIVHRSGATLSKAAELMIELAVARMRRSPSR